MIFTGCAFSSGSDITCPADDLWTIMITRIVARTPNRFATLSCPTAITRGLFGFMITTVTGRTPSVIVSLPLFACSAATVCRLVVSLPLPELLPVPFSHFHARAVL